MIRSSVRRTRDRGLAAVLLSCVLWACSSDGDGGTGPDPDPDPGGQTPAIALALSATSASVQQGATTSFTATVTRSGGFAGTVDLAVQNAPAGVTTATSNVQTAGATTTATITVQVGGSAATGGHALTVRATGAGVTAATASFTVTVTPANPGGGAGSATLDFSACPAANRPIWLAFQDGNGPWTRVDGTNHVYRFDIGAARGAFAWTTQTGLATVVAVQHMTRAELTTVPQVFCATLSPGKVVNGLLAGLGANDFAQVWLGGGAGSAGQNGAFQITGVRDGSHDLIAWRHNQLGTGNPDRGIVRRDQSLAAGGSVGTVDFGAAEAFTPATAQVTVSGLAAGEQLTHGMNYYTGTCVFAGLYQGGVAAGNTVTASGFPAAQQRPTDLHQINVTVIAGTGNRVAQEYFRVLANRTIALPAPLAAPAITSLTAPYKRLQATFTVPAEYNAASLFMYSEQAAQRTATLTATSAWIGGAAATLAMPDLSAVAGWNNAWVPAAAATTTWVVQAIGNNPTGGNVCQEGGRIASVQVLGTH